MAMLSCECGQRLRVPDDAVGKRFKCPKCGTILVSNTGGVAPPPVVAAPVVDYPPIREARPPEADGDEDRPRRRRRVEQRTTSGLAITSLILGIASIFCAPLGLVSLILGIAALISISNSQGAKTGKGMAVAGMLLPVLGVAAVLGVFFATRLAVKQVLEPFVEKVQQAAASMESGNNLKELGIAFHHYHDAMQQFPPAGLKAPQAAPDAKSAAPLLSWRVALLPYLGPDEKALYEQFRLNEPWDSPHNLSLLPRMPKVYRSPGDKDESSHQTRYQVFVGPGTAFDPQRKSSLATMQDGLSNTILVIEAEQSVPWTKPQDLTSAPGRPLPRFHVRDRRISLLMADGSVKSFRQDFDEGEMRKAITCNDGQPIDFNRLEN